VGITGDAGNIDPSDHDPEQRHGGGGELPLKVLERGSVGDPDAGDDDSGIYPG